MNESSTRAPLIFSTVMVIWDFIIGSFACPRLSHNMGFRVYLRLARMKTSKKWKAETL
jgi:hypothetical protein